MRENVKSRTKVGKVERRVGNMKVEEVFGIKVKLESRRVNNLVWLEVFG